jgi:hypothetical protein
VTLDDVGVSGVHEPLVAAVSATAGPGGVTVLPVDPGTPQVALALAVSGRVRLATGSVCVDGTSDPRALRRATRLVDVEDVTAPDGGLSVRTVVAEELALGGQRSRARHVRNHLAARGLDPAGRARWASLPPETRTELLLELGSWGGDARVLVLAGPERHGGDPLAFLDPAREIARRGFTVLALCSPTTAHRIGSLGHADVTVVPDLTPDPRPGALV